MGGLEIFGTFSLFIKVFAGGGRGTVWGKEECPSCGSPFPSCQGSFQPTTVIALSCLLSSAKRELLTKQIAGLSLVKEAKAEENVLFKYRNY